MKFTQHNPGGLNLIRRYGKDFISIGEEEIRASCIVGATTLLREWPPPDVASLKVEYLAPLFEFQPEVVVLATGAVQKFPSAALRAEFAMPSDEQIADGSETEHAARNRLRARIIAAQRHALVRMRDTGVISDDAFHPIEERLDRVEINVR